MGRRRRRGRPWTFLPSTANCGGRAGEGEMDAREERSSDWETPHAGEEQEKRHRARERERERDTSSAAKAAFRPACRPGNGSSLRCPKGPRRSRRATYQTTTRWSRHTPPDQSGGCSRRTRCGEPTGGAEQSGGASASGPRSGRRTRNHLPQQHGKHAGRGPGQHGAVDRAVGGREQHGAPSPATHRGTQGGQGRRGAQALEEGT